MALLTRLASIRAALFHFDVPSTFADRFLHDRVFKFKPDTYTIAPAPTREFWMYVLTTKIEATIRNEGDMIGWKYDNESVGPVALAAKQSLLSVIPYIMPEDNSSNNFYRFVLEHGDYGIHNVLIDEEPSGCPQISTLFDWETGCIVPALLADPLVAVLPVDLIVDDSDAPAVSRIPSDATQVELRQYQTWADHYFKAIYQEAADFQTAMVAGRDLRHLWFSLRDWRGGNSEEFFGALGE